MWHAESVVKSVTLNVCTSTQGQTQRGRGFPFWGYSFHPGYGGRDCRHGFRSWNATNQVVFDAPAHDNKDYDIYKVDTGPSLHVQTCTEKGEAPPNFGKCAAKWTTFDPWSWHRSCNFSHQRRDTYKIMGRTSTSWTSPRKVAIILRWEDTPPGICQSERQIWRSVSWCPSIHWPWETRLV